MKKTRLSISSMIMAVMLTLIPLAGVANAEDGATPVAGGFNSPQGVLVAPDGSVWVIDSGMGGETEIPFIDPETGEDTIAKMGETARVVQIKPDGTQTVAASLPSILVGMEAVGGARLALLDGTLYATSGGWLGSSGPAPASPAIAAVVKIEENQVTAVASTWDLEGDENPDGFIEESHPYGLTPGPDGNLWVADAGANTLLKVDPATGSVELVAVFDGISSPLPNPNRGGAMESDPVPSAVAFGDDGAIYVSFLPGFPFLPGSAKIVKVTADGQASDYATGLTMITDLRKGPDGGLYAVQLGQFTEQGPVPNSGAIIRVKEGADSEVVIGDLSFPTSIDFDASGDAYVTINGAGAPGTGEVVMFVGLATSADGQSAYSQSTDSQSTDEQSPPMNLPTTGGIRDNNVSSGFMIVMFGVALATLGLLLKHTKPWVNKRH